MSRKRLFTPGPTPIPESIQLEMAQPIIHHRNEDFQEILKECHDSLKYLFQTSSDVVILSGSGTSGMESVVSSIHDENEFAVFIDGGKFGERWGDLLRHYQVKHGVIKKEWGIPVSTEEISLFLQENPHTTTIYLTHSETSTGTYTDIKTISEHAKKINPNIFIVVDGITSVGSHEMKMDDWKIDAVITGSQKGLMLPPGLALVAVSSRLKEKMKQTKSKAFYLSLQEAVSAAEKNDTPWTPAVSLIVGLRTALRLVKEETLPAIWTRHQRLGESVRLGMEAIGLKLFSQSPSNAVTPIWLPESIQWKGFNAYLKQTDGITIAGGQGHLTGKIFRISHLGYYDDFDMITIVSAIERSLSKNGYEFELGKGVSVTHNYLLKTR